MHWHSIASTEYRKADNSYVRNLFQFLASGAHAAAAAAAAAA